jgi:hypothetical protein
MEEDEKIKAAEYFYRKMIEEGYDKNNFKHNLSAFLTAGKSVQYYIQRKIKSNFLAQKWYGDCLSNKKSISFLGNERDIDVHVEPVSIRRDVIIHAKQGSQKMGDFATFTVRDKNGDIKDQRRVEIKLFKSAVQNGLVEPIYKFVGWEGDEDVFSLCLNYLDELKKIVEDGKKKGMLI